MLQTLTVTLRYELRIILMRYAYEIMELSNSKYLDFRGRPRLRLRFKNIAKRNMKWRSINFSFWQQTADSRVA